MEEWRKTTESQQSSNNSTNGPAVEEEETPKSEGRKEVAAGKYKMKKIVSISE